MYLIAHVFRPLVTDKIMKNVLDSFERGQNLLRNGILKACSIDSNRGIEITLSFKHKICNVRTSPW